MMWKSINKFKPPLNEIVLFWVHDDIEKAEYCGYGRLTEDEPGFFIWLDLSQSDNCGEPMPVPVGNVTHWMRIEGPST